MKRVSVWMIAAGLAWAPQAFAEATTWEMDPVHSTIGFTAKHMMITNVQGQFENGSGTLKLDEKDPTKSSVDVNIDAKSITTRNGKRDEHLKSPDFFDVEKFPALTFKSTKIEKKDKSHYKVHGDLTIHGVTKAVVLTVEGPSSPVKDPWGGTRIGLSGSTKINRKDYGLTWNKALEAGGVVVSDEITIDIAAEFKKQDPAAATAAAPAQAPAPAPAPAPEAAPAK